MKSFFTCIAIIATFTLSAQNDWKIFANESFSMDHDPTWKKTTNGEMGTAVLFMTDQKTSTDLFKENINIVTQDLSASPMSLSEFTQLSEQQIKTMIPGSKIISSKTKNNNGEDGIEYHEFVFTGTQSTYELKFIQNYYIKNKVAYVITFTAEAKEFQAYQKTAQKMLASFRLK